MTSSSVLRRKLDKTSLLMLLYPLVNLAVILPLSVFRLAGLAGQHGSPQALAVCGCIFALGGLANTILYSFSRVSILSLLKVYMLVVFNPDGVICRAAYSKLPCQEVHCRCSRYS